MAKTIYFTRPSLPIPTFEDNKTGFLFKLLKRETSEYVTASSFFYKALDWNSTKSFIRC
jgi:hypothetical protein